jgi:diacylglycerol kinase (ATP)
MPKYKLIVNPTSGRGTGGKLIPEIEAELISYGLDFDTIKTDYPWHAAELARQAVVDGYEFVISAGGDGTCNEVINGLMTAQTAGHGKAKMGVLTVGRGNDFGYSMGVPTDWKEGCKIIAEGNSRPIDIGKVTGGLYPEGRYFGNGVGIGFDAVVGFEAVKLTFLSGFPSYIVAALKTIFLYYDAPLLRIESDGDTITQPCLMVSIMNGIRLGGGFTMAPESTSNDRKFDICVVGHVSRPKIFALIGRFTKGTQEGHPAVRFLRSPKIVVSAVSGTIPAHADGETICVKGDQLIVEIAPQTIDLLSKSG